MRLRLRLLLEGSDVLVSEGSAHEVLLDYNVGMCIHGSFVCPVPFIHRLPMLGLL
jgi:hypothetical protein